MCVGNVFVCINAVVFVYVPGTTRGNPLKTFWMSVYWKHSRRGECVCVYAHALALVGVYVCAYVCARWGGRVNNVRV